MFKSFWTIILISLLCILVFSKDDGYNFSNVSFQKPQATSDIWLDVNRFWGVFRNNGIWHYDIVAATQGTEWPAGSGKSPVFAAGQWIGAKVNGEVRVAGSIFSSTDFQPGKIDSIGIADSPEDKKYRWYEIRSDGTGDWTNWPTDQGAPVDANGNPLLMGDQTIFTVWNDLTNHPFFGSNELGSEIRQLAFAFEDQGALGDIQFIKWQIVNKSDQVWDSTFFTIWFDPDLGDASDDLFGCDTVLNLGYTYNDRENDDFYGSPPPALGVELLQGSLIDSQGLSVILPDGTQLLNKKLLSMSSFMVLPHTDASTGDPETAEYAWSFMQAIWPGGVPLTYGEFGRTGTQRTYYMFPGDPITQSGWIEPYSFDQRMILTTGPFSMPPWVDDNKNGITDIGEPGVQEIIIGVIMAKGENRLDSVGKLKKLSELTQLAYAKNFKYKEPPQQPFVNTSELSNEIILTWDETSEYNKNGTLYDSEDFFVSRVIGDTIYVNNLPIIIDDSTYNFFGYKVYQYSSVSGTDPVIVDGWDIGENKNPQNYTKQRYIRLTENKNPKVGIVDTKLINGKTYYYGVVAEGFLEFGKPKIIESSPTIVSVVPRITPGTIYSSQFGDTLEVLHTTVDSSVSPSDGKVIAWVVDPSQTTGLTYTVLFNADSTWNLENSNGDTVAFNQTNQTGNDAYNIYDGLMIKVIAGTILNTINDIFTFTAPAAAQSTNSKLKNDLKKIKVVPNPYYGMHSGEMDQINRWVQFTYLPPKCTIRIFTMSGHLVRKLEKNDPTTPFLRWDLLNEYDIPVASGIYIYHIEASGIGNKIGKMVIFMSTYRPDTWRSLNTLYER